MPKQHEQDVSPFSVCPCGSGKLFKKCCSPILADQSLALTPEKLMRSRYTAYVLKDSTHLLRTWDMSTRPNSLKFEQHIIWLNLVVEDVPEPLPNDNAAQITFQATFIHNDKLMRIKERALFTYKNSLWFYKQGELSTRATAIPLKGLCPCGSGKKYKRCCRP